MKRHVWTLSLLVSVALTLGACKQQDTESQSVKTEKRPNVIFVMPDDISHSAFSYYKDNGPQTPNIDKFAEGSVRLADFHVSPSCSPTRGALLTGRPSDVVGVWHTINGRNMMRADEITMADIFKANGYATGLFFKWHLGDNYPFRPKDRGFEEVAWVKGGGTGQQPDSDRLRSGAP